MATIKKNNAFGTEEKALSSRTVFAEHLWEESWTYIKTIVDTAREPFLILDKDFRVMAGNESYYRLFQVTPEDTERKSLYEIGNGEWNIPALRKLLEDILPNGSFFNGFSVTHEFPSIGRRVIMLNSRQIHFKEDATSEAFQPIILLAMEDVTEIMSTAEELAERTNQSEAKMSARAGQMEGYLSALQKEINGLKQNS